MIGYEQLPNPDFEGQIIEMNHAPLPVMLMGYDMAYRPKVDEITVKKYKGYFKAIKIDQKLQWINILKDEYELLKHKKQVELKRLCKNLGL